MTFVALCSLKGSPGVTSVALALAARWPRGGRPVLVECDPAGGDLLARFRLETAPSLVSLAAAARRGGETDRVREHAQRLPGGLPVVVGPAGAEQARAALGELESARILRQAADADDTVLIADCGRADPASPALPMLRAADVVLVLTHARDDALSHLATRIETVTRWSAHAVYVLVGDGYPTAEVVRALRITVWGRIPYDAKGAAALAGQPGARAVVDRSSLGRAAARLAQRITAHQAAAAAPEARDDAVRPALPTGSGGPT